MVLNIILVIVGLSVCYAYTNHNREFSATASAIQQIWSGTCRLSCRENQYRSFHAISEFIDPEHIVKPESCKEAQNEIPSITGITDECICETCPCSLIETVLKTCRPATNIYSKCIEILSDFYCDIVKTLAELYVYVTQVMITAEANELRSAQLIPVRAISSTKFSDLVKNGQKLKDELKKTSKTFFSLKPSRSITFSKKSDVNWEIAPGTSKASKLTLISENKSLSDDSSRNCSRCNEKGAICIDKCPKAKEKKE